MIRKMPIIRPDISAFDIYSGFKPARNSSEAQDFISALSGMTHAKYIYPVNSGLTAFYLLLKALQGISPGKEVVLPAYTAGSLITAVRKAGLKPVLCDVSLKDFNMDRPALSAAISGGTLAVLAVHMFGIPIRDISGFKKMIPQRGFLLEDCAQAMGAKVDDRPVGCFSDAGFFSFNRGKNLSLSSGGCVFTGNGAIAAGLQPMTEGLKKPGLLGESILLLKMAASALFTDPLVYGLGYPLIACFKDNAPAKDFEVSGLSAFQERLGSIRLAGCQRGFSARHNNGIFIINGLQGRDDLLLPEISGDSYPVFNRLPVLFKNARSLERKQKELWDAGIESSRMYNMPLHHMFDLGYRKADFPNANYLSGHLLTLPAYPSLKRGDMEKMIEVIIK